MFYLKDIKIILILRILSVFLAEPETKYAPDKNPAHGCL
jgi:hypothetical protein